MSDAASDWLTPCVSDMSDTQVATYRYDIKIVKSKQEPGQHLEVDVGAAGAGAEVQDYKLYLVQVGAGLFFVLPDCTAMYCMIVLPCTAMYCRVSSRGWMVWALQVELWYGGCHQPPRYRKRQRIALDAPNVGSTCVPTHLTDFPVRHLRLHHDRSGATPRCTTRARTRCCTRRRAAGRRSAGCCTCCWTWRAALNTCTAATSYTVGCCCD